MGEIWNSKGEKAFKDDLNTCGKKCLGKASCVTSCIEGKEGYGPACSQCFGDLAQCTASKCWAKCIAGDTPACEKCVISNCNDGFKQCSGLTPPSEELATKELGCDEFDERIWIRKGAAN